MSTTPSEPLACLVTQGKILAGLLQQAKPTNGSNGVSVSHQEVKAAIEKLLVGIRNAHGRSFFPKESIGKLVDRVELTIEEFKINDPDLQKRVNNLKSSAAHSATAASSSVPAECSDYELLSMSYPAAFEDLGFTEKRYLFCASLLLANDTGLKKRELINWWMGMDLTENPNQGIDMLAKFVSMGFIQRSLDNKRFWNRYFMNDGVREMVRQEMINLGKIEKEESWSVMQCNNQWRHESEAPPDDNFVPEAVLNIQEETLNENTFAYLSKMMKSVKVLHLGSRLDNPENYILVEDIEHFKHLKSSGELRLLSLQGVSGITKLPESICKNENLRVLDLKACHNLETLPEDIKLLINLTHLDLSECFLLGQLPKGIGSLSKLKVLKGFVVTPDTNSSTPTMNNLQDGNSNTKPKKDVSSSCCTFQDLSMLLELIKLSVRARRMNFPTEEDMDCLCKLQQLKSLRIAWVGSPTDASSDCSFRKFPKQLKKLELRAAPESTVTLLLGLLSEKANCVEKLYIRGGGHCKLYSSNTHCFTSVKELDLRYLPKLHCDWDEFKLVFPNISRLEIRDCPNLSFFPCDVHHGRWRCDPSNIMEGNQVQRE